MLNILKEEYNKPKVSWFMADGDNPGLLHPTLHPLQHQRSRSSPELLFVAGVRDCGRLSAATCTKEEDANALQYR